MVKTIAVQREVQVLFVNRLAVPVKVLLVVQATVLLLAVAAIVVLQAAVVLVLLTHLQEAATCLPAVEVQTTVTLQAEVLLLQAVLILLQEAVTRLLQDNKQLLLKALQEVVA